MLDIWEEHLGEPHEKEINSIKMFHHMSENRKALTSHPSSLACANKFGVQKGV